MANQVFEAIIEFNQRVLHIEPRPINLLSEGELEITEKCLNEEVGELRDAHTEGDMIGAVDSMFDNIYFAVGALYKMGLNADSIEKGMMAVHDANMRKKLGVNYRRGDGQAADAVKPADWVGPEVEISNILDAQAPV